jgi:hypothetical protein
MGLIYARFVAVNYSQTREGLYSEVRTVDMSANDGDASPRPPVLRDCKSEQGTLVPEGRMGTVKRYYLARQFNKATYLVK